MSSTATEVTTGCPADGCNGYELTSDLELPSVGSDESNWTPIGDRTRRFNSKFDGNSHTIF